MYLSIGGKYEICKNREKEEPVVTQNLKTKFGETEKVIYNPARQKVSFIGRDSI